MGQEVPATPCPPPPISSQPLHGGLHPLGPSEQLDEAATIWGCDTESLRAKQGPRQDQPLPVAEESQEQEAGAEEHKAANEQHHQHCGAWGGRAVSAPPRPPSHLFAPMSARSPPGATRGGKSMCSHRGMKPH